MFSVSVRGLTGAEWTALGMVRSSCQVGALVPTGVFKGAVNFTTLNAKLYT